MRSIDPGSYRGQIVDYGMSKTKADDPQAFITFVINPTDTTKLNGQPLQLPVKTTWYGGLATKAKEEGKRPPIEFTVKTLLDCGFESEALEILAAGPPGNALKLGSEMDLTIEDNTWEGSTNSRIKFINIPGQTFGPKKMAYEEAANLGSIGGMRAELLKQRQQRKSEVPGAAKAAETLPI